MVLIAIIKIMTAAILTVRLTTSRIRITTAVIVMMMMMIQ